MLSEPVNPRARGPLLDPGWLFLTAGIVLLGATVLIPAKADLDEARFYLRRALAAERHRLDRMERYQEYAEALSRADESTVMALAALQLNKGPQGMSLLPTGDDFARRSASVFPALEPPALVLPQRRVNRSLLEEWSADDSSRLWLLAVGSMLVLIGLMPPTRATA